MSQPQEIEAMHELCQIMRKTQSWRHGCWWDDPHTNRILAHAERLGLVRRQSVTQVEWTERGAALARKYA